MRKFDNPVYNKPDGGTGDPPNFLSIDVSLLRSIANLSRQEDDTAEKLARRIVGFADLINKSPLPNDFKILEQILYTFRIGSGAEDFERKRAIELWQSGKRQSRFEILTPEEGALFSWDERRLIEDAKRKVRDKGWEVYVSETTANGITTARSVPNVINEHFLKYLQTLKTFELEDLDEQARRLEECAHVILNNTLPDDYQLIMAMNQQFKDASTRVISLLSGRDMKLERPVGDYGKALSSALKRLIDKGVELRPTKKP